MALLLLLVVAFMTLANENSLTSRNLLDGGRQASVVAIVAMGQALVITGQGIDLSPGDRPLGGDGDGRTGHRVQVLGIAAALSAGLAAGLVKAGLCTRMHVNPFIAMLWHPVGGPRRGPGAPRPARLRPHRVP